MRVFVRSAPRCPLAFALFASFALGCSEHGSPAAPSPRPGVTLTPATVSIAAGDGQAGEVGLPLSAPLSVRVIDAHGAAVPGTIVTWSAGSPTFRLSATTSTTDAAGTTSVTATLGTTAGDQTVTASVGGTLVAHFVLHAAPGAATAIRTTTDTLVLEVGHSARLSLTGTDRYGNTAAVGPATWTSSNGKVATVGGDGTVTAIGVGNGRVMATISGVAASTAVAVGQFVGDLALAVARDTAASLAAVHRDGDRVIGLTDRTATLSAGAVYLSADGKQRFIVVPDSLGRPAYAQTGATLLVFGNWTGTTVDFAEIDSSGRTTVHRGVSLPASARARLTALRTTYARDRHSSHVFSRSPAAHAGLKGMLFPTGLPSARAAGSFDDFATRWKEFGESVEQVQIAACVAAQQSSDPVLAQKLCTGLVLQALLAEIDRQAGLGEDEIQVSTSALGIAMDTPDCLFELDGIACASALWDATNGAVSAYISLYHNMQGLIDNVQTMLDASTVLSIDGGDRQTGMPGQPLAVPISVRLTGVKLGFHFGPVPLSHVWITFETSTPGGRVTPAAVETDKNGVASAIWTLALVNGQQVASAILPGVSGSPARFLATAQFIGPILPPTVSITSPAPGLSVRAGSTVDFAGTAKDAAGAILSGSALTWSSDRDGVLGAGTTLHLSSLSSGTHQITLAATDAGQRTGRAVTTVYVAPSCVPSASLESETYKDGTNVPPGGAFTKTWTIRNAGSCDWAPGWSLHYRSGPLSASHGAVTTTQRVAPGASYAFAVDMRAPAASGAYRDDWELLDDGARTVSVGGSPTVWAKIAVTPDRGPVAHLSIQAQGKSTLDNGLVTYSVPPNGSMQVTFDAGRSTAGSTPIAKYEWLSNGSVFATGITATAPFGTPSNTILLRVTDANGLVSTASAQLNLSFAPPASPPAAHFAISGGGKAGADGATVTYVVQTNASVAVTFDATPSVVGSAPIVTYQWSSNGTVIGTGRALTFSFGTPSNAITLKVTDANGLSSTAAAQINLTFQQTNVGPTAHFSMSGGGKTGADGSTLAYVVPTNGNVSITFNAAASMAGTSPIVTYRWASNGTTIGTGATLTYAFGTPSNAITLTVTDANGLVSTASAQVNLTIQQAVSPTAHFSMSGGGKSGTDGSTLSYTVPVNGNVQMSFDAGTSVPGSAAIVAYQWASNGTVIGSSRTLTYAFGTPSNAVTLKITDAAGLTSTAGAQINLSFQQAVGPTAHFSMTGGGKSGGDGSTLSYTVPVNGNVAITFDAGATVAGSSAIVAYRWASNGTTIGTSATLTYAFGTPSNAITLTVTDANGLTGTASAQVNLSFQQAVGPTAHFTMSGGGKSGADGSTLSYTVPVNGNVSVAFDAGSSTSGSSTIASYQWASNGTAISSAKSFSYTFGTPSNTITLKVTDANGLTSTATGQINLSFQQAVNPTLNVSPASGTQTTTFTVSGSNYTPGGMVNRYVAQPGQAFQQIGAITATGAGAIAWSYTGTCAQLVGTVQIYTVDVASGKQSPTITEQVAADPSCAAPTLGVAPTSGTQKTTFTVSGSNYTPGGTVNRFVAQPGQAFQQITAITATSAGTISWSYTGTCAQAIGTVQIYTVDVSTGRSSPVITEAVAHDPSC